MRQSTDIPAPQTVPVKPNRAPQYNESDLDIYGSVHHKTVFIKMTNKMQLCRIIYYAILLWLLYMFWAILLLIIRSILTVIIASGFINACRYRLLSWLSRKWLNSSLTALHVSSDIIAHHQEHLNCNYSFWFYSRVSLLAAVMAE
jgi:hypothetical protein